MGWLWRAAAVALVMGLALEARAAEIKVLCIPAMRASFEALLPQFERDSGNKVTIHYQIFPGQKQRIESGDFDVAIFATPQIEDLNKQGRTAAATTGAGEA